MAAILGTKLELESSLDVKTAQSRLSTLIVGLLPFVMFAVLMLLSEDYRVGVATVTGAGTLLVAIILEVIALIMMRRTMEGAL